jgi:hypothetical protein
MQFRRGYCQPTRAVRATRSRSAAAARRGVDDDGRLTRRLSMHTSTRSKSALGDLSRGECKKEMSALSLPRPGEARRRPSWNVGAPPLTGFEVATCTENIGLPLGATAERDSM